MIHLNFKDMFPLPEYFQSWVVLAFNIRGIYAVVDTPPNYKIRPSTFIVTMVS